MGFLFCYGQGEKFWQLIHPMIYIHYLPQSGGKGLQIARDTNARVNPRLCVPLYSISTLRVSIRTTNIFFGKKTQICLWAILWELGLGVLSHPSTQLPQNCPEANLSFFPQDNIFAIRTPSLRSVANTT